MFWDLCPAVQAHLIWKRPQLGVHERRGRHVVHWGVPPALRRTPYTAAYPSLASRRDFSPFALRPTPSCTAASPPTNALRCVFFIDQVQGWEVALSHSDRSVKGGDCEIYRDDTRERRHDIFKPNARRVQVGDTRG